MKIIVRDYCFQQYSSFANVLIDFLNGQRLDILFFSGIGLFAFWFLFFQSLNLLFYWKLYPSFDQLFFLFLLLGFLLQMCTSPWYAGWVFCFELSFCTLWAVGSKFFISLKPLKFFSLFPIWSFPVFTHSSSLK